jgi:protein-tyrosine phosphatase
MARVSVCFVCLGNICRSPTAEGVFRALLEKENLAHLVEVDSAGTAAYHTGERADPRSRTFAKKRGYELLSIARQFVADDFKSFDYVLAMDEQNLSDLLSRARSLGVTPKHLGLFRDFDETAPKGASVPDPYYGGDAGFDEVLDQCERACQGLIAHLRAHELA